MQVKSRSYQICDTIIPIIFLIWSKSHPNVLQSDSYKKPISIFFLVIPAGYIFGEPLNSEGARIEGSRGVKETKMIFCAIHFFIRTTFIRTFSLRFDILKLLFWKILMLDANIDEENEERRSQEAY